MKTLAIAVVFTVSLSALTAVGDSRHTNQRRSNDRSEVSVTVTFLDNQRVRGARVFWLSNDGKELDSNVTNSDGMATLRSVSPSERPRFLLVEIDQFLVVGSRYSEGLTEYTFVPGHFGLQ